MLLREIAETKISAAHLRKILDTIPTLASCNLPDGSNEFLNQRWHDYTGLSPQEARGRGWRVAVHPEDLQKVLDTFRALRTSGEPRQAGLSRGLPFEIEQRARRKDGQYRWFLVRYHPFRDEHGRLVRWYATGTDIDDRKRTEDRVRNENIALREDIVRSSMFEEIVGSSAPLRRVLAQVEKVAPTVSTVLILGETETVKNLLPAPINSLPKPRGR